MLELVFRNGLTRGWLDVRFIRTEKDPDGAHVRVENAFKGADGTYYLLLRRLPPEYAKSPTFVVELSSDRVEIRGVDTDSPVYHKAYAHQDFSDSEIKFLAKARQGKSVSPLLGCPNVTRVLGRKSYCLTDAELTPILSRYVWKLVGGQR